MEFEDTTINSLIEIENDKFTEDNTDDNTCFTYQVIPKQNDCIRSDELWSNYLKNGKKITYVFSKTWTTGDIEIEVTKDEVGEIMNFKDGFKLNNYSCCVNEISGFGTTEWYLKDKNTFSKEELKEIDKLITEPTDGNDDDDYDLLEKMEEYGWSLDDTLYYVECSFILKQLIPE